MAVAVAAARRDRPRRPLHAVRAGLPLTRATRDVDMILHIETGAATFGGVRRELERLGYRLREPVGSGPVHRFVRGAGDGETVDVMVADRLPLNLHPKVLQREVFAVPGGTSALRKTVNCEVTAGARVVTLSIPDVLGALVLKGAAYLDDSRDRGRHLDDAVALACAVTDPVEGCATHDEVFRGWWRLRPTSSLYSC